MIDDNQTGLSSSTDVESGEAEEEEITFDVDQSYLGQHEMAIQTILGIIVFLFLPSYIYLFVSLGLPDANHAAIVCVTLEAVVTVSLIWPILVLLPSRLLSVSLSSRGISCRQQTYSCCYCSQSTPKIKSYIIPFESIIGIYLCKNTISVVIKLNNNSRCMPSYPIHLGGIHNPHEFLQMANELKMKNVRNQYPSLESLLGQSEAFPPNWKRKE